jgi:Helicase
MTAINRESFRTADRSAVHQSGSMRAPPDAAAPEDTIAASAFDAAFRVIEQSASVVMVLGEAGTGKTTFLHKLWRSGEERQVFLAPTGVAKVGARVMAVRNDAIQRWANGSLGTVVSLDDNRVSVQFDDSCEAEIASATWERIRYRWNDAAARVEATVTGKYKQLPLIHAWASTMHKAQGLTLDDVRVDFSSGAFAPGQVYVALSRARSTEGLSLTRPLRSSDVRIDPRVAAFVKAFESEKS